MRTISIVLSIILLIRPAIASASLPAIDWTAEAGAEAQTRATRIKTIVSLTALGIAVACGILGATFGMGAASIRTQLEQTAPGDATRSARIAEGEQARLMSNVAWSAAGGFGLVGGLVWVF